jgi:D-beta-D-heptose 7-phosphate kinase/D-beta-D-heptose 1-phosphate adenosyltransferase
MPRLNINSSIKISRVREILTSATKTRVLVLGDVMLDQFLWGRVARISPEAPVPVVDFERESFMPGGAANVARNLTAFWVATEVFSVVGKDDAAMKLKTLLRDQNVNCDGLATSNDPRRITSLKTRVVAHQQQVVRIDRESRHTIFTEEVNALQNLILKRIPAADAVIIGDYGKGVVCNGMLSLLKRECRKHGVWLSMDPKPIRYVNLQNLSLITPNRTEAFELANMEDDIRAENPLKDKNLMRVAEKLLGELSPAVLLITLGDQGMLLCQRGQKPFHIPTMAQEVFDVSGAGDTVIASFTLAIAAGASPIEAAIFSNHAAGIVVGKVGTATVQPEELLASFRR